MVFYPKETIWVSKNLKNLRMDSGLSQKQVADAIHVDRSTYTNYELGKICPPLNTIYQLADVFHVDYTEILEDGEAEPGSLKDSGTRPKQYPRAIYNLTPLEQDLILRYRKMSEKEQIALQEFMENPRCPEK